ncbi:hypothetical protein [Cylindrospermopsis raciborskii]|uniref:hypothetical protein n=1 Tax=Cylindrospermopsis raciborskii TaxID=77022 RepID=UPI001177D6A9|nr:hypothetical protein [Cylindrospermopsis raciborskii]
MSIRKKTAQIPIVRVPCPTVNSQPPRKKFRGAVIGDKVNSDRLVGILWSHPVFNPQKSRGAVIRR